MKSWIPIKVFHKFIKIDRQPAALAGTVASIGIIFYCYDIVIGLAHFDIISSYYYINFCCLGIDFSYHDIICGCYDSIFVCWDIFSLFYFLTGFSCIQWNIDLTSLDLTSICYLVENPWHRFFTLFVFWISL